MRAMPRPATKRPATRPKRASDDDGGGSGKVTGRSCGDGKALTSGAGVGAAAVAAAELGTMRVTPQRRQNAASASFALPHRGQGVVSMGNPSYRARGVEW